MFLNFVLGAAAGALGSFASNAIVSKNFEYCFRGFYKTRKTVVTIFIAYNMILMGVILKLMASEAESEGYNGVATVLDAAGDAMIETPLVFANTVLGLPGGTISGLYSASTLFM